MSAASSITRRGWVLYGAMIVVSGVPYLFTARAIDAFSPAGVVAGRCLGAALLLLPLALHRHALRAAWHRRGWVLLFAALALGIPFVLITTAQEALPTEVSALLISTVPLFGAFVAVVLGDRAVLRPWRLFGLALGFAGVAVALLGPGFAAGTASAGFAIGAILVAAASHACGPFLVSRRLAGVPAVGTVTLALAAVGLVYLPVALLTPARPPTLRALPLLAPGEPVILPSLIALTLLAVVSTVAASMLYFALVREVGPARTTLYSYVTPLVAIALGIVFLGEPLSPTLLIGIPIVLVGCWLAATGGLHRGHGGHRLKA